MVQPTGVNALIALVSSQPTPASSQSDVDDSDFSHEFSQLLSDSGKQSGEQFDGQLQGKFAKPSALGALSAQEIPNAQTDKLAQLLGGSETVISADDANALLSRVDKILGQDRTPSSVQAFAQIKEQLQAIARTGQSKTIGEILQSSPAVKESKLSVLGLTALLSPRKDAAQPVNQQVEHQQEEQEELSAGALLAVPTAIFRPVTADDGAAQAAGTESQEKKNDLLDTVSVITPLAAVTVSPALAVALNDKAFRSQTDLDAAIPPLALAKPEVEELPEVSLPSWKAQPTSPNTGVFESLAAAASAAHASKKLTNDESLIGNASSDVLSNVGNISSAGGANATQTVSAAQPVNVVPTHGYINHAPVSEQVHVAVRNATKDGLEQITVQLDPLELGRVEVNIQTNREGLTQISFIVDKAETFDSLSRDARVLERSLQEAGIKTDTGSMQFNLRQQSQQQHQHSDANAGKPHGLFDSEQIAATGTAIDPFTRNYILNVREGVDISA